MTLNKKITLRDSWAPSDTVQATNFLARTSGLDTTHTNAYKAFINGIVADGYWAKMDAIWIIATQDSTTCALNLVQNQWNLTGGFASTFVADRGFTNDGSGFSRCDTTFTPSTAVASQGAVMGLNDVHIMSWNSTAGIAQGDLGTWFAGGYFAIRSSTTTVNMEMFGGGIDGGTAFSSTATGFYLGCLATSLRDMYHGISGSLTAISSGVSYTSSSLSTASVNLDGINGQSDGNHQLGGASLGRGLTSTEATAYYGRWHDFMVAVGNPVT